jgi:hypothetical protein
MTQAPSHEHVGEAGQRGEHGESVSPPLGDGTGSLRS